MSSQAHFDNFTSALFGKTRRALLALFYTHADEPFYLRQIIRAVALGQGTVQPELAHLTAAGLLWRFSRGNQVYYQANHQSPIFPELKSLMIKTAGVAGVLREALAGLQDRIRIAFLYGSMAAGTHKTRSDVDLMIIGNVVFAEVTAALHPAQETLRREINPSVYSLAEFRKKLKAGNHFLNSVAHAAKIFLFGDEREFARLGKKRLAD